MSNAFQTLEENFPIAIEQMPSAFDTHKFILVLAQENQRTYIRALNESESETPFQAVHSAIGKALKRLSLEADANILEIEANSSSDDIFGNTSSCSKWVRLS